MPTPDIIDVESVEDQLWKNMATNIAIPKLRDMMEESENDTVVMKGIEIVLNRAYGKPKELVEHSGKVSLLLDLEKPNSALTTTVTPVLTASYEKNVIEGTWKDGSDEKDVKGKESLLLANES